MIKNSLRRTVLAAGFVFCFVLAWSVLLFQGLPASDTDDWYRIFMARQVDWGTYASSFLRPWSLSLHWDGQTEALDVVHSKRILNPIMLKLSQQFFGPSPFAMYVLTKGLFFAGCVSIVFLLLAQVVPWLYAAFGAAVFLFVPVHYSHVLWVADSATLSYFFLFLGISIFYAVQRNILEHGSEKEFRWLILALFAAGWMGIKTKESVLVLPLVVFLYSLACFRSWKQTPFKFLLLNIAMAFVAFQIVPVTNLSGGTVPSARFNLATIGRLFFRNYDCGYDNETVPALFSWELVFPVSVARTLGFFLLWTVIISLGFLGWQKWVLKNKERMPFWNHALIRISGIWLLVEIPFLGMFQPDPRYFSGTMAPIIILTARLAYCAIHGAGKNWRLGLLLLWIFATGFNVYGNVKSALWLRMNMGRKFNYLLETARVVLEDLKGRKVTDNLEVGSFYAGIRNGQPEAAIKNHVFYADLGIGYDGWNQVPAGQNSLDHFKRRSKEGYQYYLTVDELDLSGRTEIEQIGTVDGINKSSVLERLLIKQKKRITKIKIYKHA